MEDKRGMGTGAKVALIAVVALLGICGIGIIGALAGGGGEEPTDTATVAEKQQTQAPESETEAAPPPAATEGPATSAPPPPAQSAAPPPGAPGIGTPARDGKFEFVVTSVERIGKTVGTGFTEETAQGEYIIVRVNVTNIGDEPQTLNSGGQTLYNDKGQEFEPSSDALFSVEGASDFFLEEINPGNSITGAPLLFDVPPGTVLDRIELHDSFFSGGVEVSLKGS